MAKTVKIKKGDTLSKIAKVSGTTVSALASANKIKDINKINVGQSLSIPTSSSSKTKVVSPSSTKTQSENPFFPNYVAPKTSTSSYKSTIPTGQTLSTYKGTGFNKKTPSPLKTVGTFFKNSLSAIKNIGKDTINKKGTLPNASAYDGYQIQPDAINITPVDQVQTPYEIVKSFGGDVVNKVGEVVSDIGSTVADNFASTTTYDSADYNTANSQTMDLGLGIESDTTTPDTSTKSSTSGLEETLSNPEVTATEGGTTTFAQGSTPAIVNGINNANANFGVNSSTLNNPWMTKDTKSEFQGSDIVSYADNASKSFSSPEEAMKYFNTPQGLASVKAFTDKGGKVEDIIKRVQPVTNGVVGPQTFQEFEQKLNDLDPTNQALVNAYTQSKLSGFGTQTIDTKNIPSELKGVVDAQNKQLVMASANLSKVEKMLYEQATQDKLTAQEERDTLQKVADSRETAIERKTDIATKQYKADMKAEEAETEMNRITAKKNLTEFLAQIGALRTDGNAQLGIETLDQKYQAQKSSIRAKYSTLINNVQADADEKISELQYNLKMNTLELYKDLNKTDREIRMDIMKMQYDYQSDVLKSNTSYQEKLSDLKIKQSKENSDLSRDVLKLQTEILSSDPTIGIELAKKLAGEYLSSKPTDTSISTVASLGNKTKMAETEPKYTGESLKLTSKISKEFENLGGTSNQLIKVQNLLNDGWSLQQIAKNTSMPTDLYNYLANKLTTK